MAVNNTIKTVDLHLLFMKTTLKNYISGENIRTTPSARR